MKIKPPFKKPVFNDPIYGFITIPSELIFNLIQHSFFQRLRRIKQLGLTYLVYPGATHTRFQHAMGSMYLMCQTIETLRSKGHGITDEEAEAVSIAVLLHDIGHGPFSHVLENSIVTGINHEQISSMMMKQLNKEFNGQLNLAIKIFNSKYHKKFLHQLVSSQLDMDRMDYLKRDSFYSGVSEGIISWERIIIMLNVVNDELAVEAKGIYPVEKFIIARRLMYWQVYLHKTVLAADILLVNILKRAKELAQNGEKLFATPSLEFFLRNNCTLEDNVELENFASLDDYDIFSSIKVWASHSDKILSTLCRNMIERNLARTEIQNHPFSKEKISRIKEKIRAKYKFPEYFFLSDKIKNSAYNPKNDKINVVFKNGVVKDIAEASDNILAKPVVKYYICYPKEITV